MVKQKTITMKTLPNNLSRLFFLLVAILLLSSCRKNDTTTTTVTADDAADAITYAFESSSGGTADELADASQYTLNQGYGKTEGANTLSCGVPFDSTITLTYNSANTTASYTHNWHMLLSCNGPVPTSLAFEGSYSGNFNGLRMQSANTGTRALTVTGLEPSAQVYTFNGSTSRTGSHTAKVRNQNTFNVTIQSNLSNVTVSKSTYRITGGSGTVTATCNESNGTSKTFNGTIVFNGNSTATLTINGTNYTIQLY